MSSRNPKACQACRRHRVKCNGQTPCNNCVRRSVSCLYREALRTKRKSPNPGSLCGDTSNGPRISNMPGTGLPAAQSGISESSRNDELGSATHGSSTLGLLQLYYGPSSQFSFIHQIHRGFSVPTEPRRGAVQDFTLSLGRFLQKGLFFGTGPLSNPVAGSPNPDIQQDLHPDLASSFINYFISTTRHIVPFLNESDLRAYSRCVCEQELGQNLEPQLVGLNLPEKSFPNWFNS